MNTLAKVALWGVGIGTTIAVVSALTGKEVPDEPDGEPAQIWVDEGCEDFDLRGNWKFVVRRAMVEQGAIDRLSKLPAPQRTPEQWATVVLQAHAPQCTWPEVTQDNLIMAKLHQLVTDAVREQLGLE